jgi:hypothetical protein
VSCCYLFGRKGAARVEVSGRSWRAVSAGVGVGDGEAEGFEFGDRFAEPAVVVHGGGGG